MKWIDLDASGWTGALDFYDALLLALGAPEWHGRSVAALNDSMIWGGINAVEPPYTVRIAATGTVPDEVICNVKQVKECLAEARAEFRERRGYDVVVELELIGDWAERAPCDQVLADAHARLMAETAARNVGKELKQYRIILHVADDGSPDPVGRMKQRLRDAVAPKPKQ